ncbi:response regulator [Aquiflexum gelatinilyticum]|uniref:Response regulator n=1 Tax=Aquiflexum gelatinilyticum TaxID=2961943 RepID=A0A9X2P555_9BACT|nr:response regulator [Aquiflexum gelatinilyticum]MCR9013815.1 response regulator [Aquiflexum gelatinilyticum]MCS4433465.1 response regulator [Aquiflexum gelatinilyticum]
MNEKSIKILLADDDEADRLLFKEAFDELNVGTSVETVNDGDELMHLMQNTEAENLPQILFLDINMPRKNGLECLKEIRADVKFKEVSVAIYSTSSSENDMQETFLNGANVYIHKPNDFQKLKKLLEKAIIYANVYQDPPFNKDNFLLVAE